MNTLLLPAGESNLSKDTAGRNQWKSPKQSCLAEGLGNGMGIGSNQARKVYQTVGGVVGI